MTKTEERLKHLNKVMRLSAITMDTYRKEAKILYPLEWESALRNKCEYQVARADYNEARVEYNNILFKAQRAKVNADYDRLWAQLEHLKVSKHNYEKETQTLSQEISRLRYQRGKVFG